MKKTFKKLFCIIFTFALIAALAVIPAAAEDVSHIDGIEFQNFNPNSIAKTIVNAIMGIAIVAGIVYGGWNFAQGIIGGDPKEKRDGIVAIIASLVVGGLIIAIVNMILV